MDIQIDSNEIIKVLQEQFPREYTICVQHLHIQKLEKLLEGQDEKGE